MLHLKPEIRIERTESNNINNQKSIFKIILFCVTHLYPFFLKKSTFFINCRILVESFYTSYSHGKPREIKL